AQFVLERLVEDVDDLFLTFHPASPVSGSPMLSASEPPGPHAPVAPAAGRDAHRGVFPTLLEGSEPVPRPGSDGLASPPLWVYGRNIDTPRLDGRELDQALGWRVAGALEQAALGAGAGVGTDDTPLCQLVDLPVNGADGQRRAAAAHHAFGKMAIDDAGRWQRRIGTAQDLEQGLLDLRIRDDEAGTNDHERCGPIPVTA